MPEQATRRGHQVTSSNTQGPFENLLIRLGIRGLNLKEELDVIPPDQLSRMTNVDHDTNGAVSSRPGQTSLATGGTKHHSVRKLRDEQNSTFTRIWGTDTDLRIGASGALSSIDAGYSGDPLALVPHRPPLSGDPWMFVADRSRMRKVRADGLDIPIGLPAPGAALGAALGTQQLKQVAIFGAADSTAAASWTGTPGSDAEGNVPGTPTTSDTVTPVPNPAVTFTTAGGAIVGAYDSWWGMALTRDLNSFGTVDITDDDLIHFWIKTSHPELALEVRLYFVVSSTFTASALPGLNATDNTDAYVKGLRQNDFVQFIQRQQIQIEAAETARVFALRDQDLKDRKIADDRDSWNESRAVQDPARARSLQVGAGAHQWFELGVVGATLRRGDFQRIGNTPGRDWGTITGLVVYVKHDIVEGVDEAIDVALGDLYVTGGYGLDTVEPGAQQYDWRATHYDPRTGAESNGSPEMHASAYLDSRRQQVDVTTVAFGDSAVRQRIYRRGGSLIDDWYFVGVNASDGGSFTDQLSDDAIVAAGTLPIDHFQPVPTINDAGTTVLAQAVHALWGPIEGMLLACGDPYRPGHLYFCLPDAPDHWSASGNVEVCPPSEVLMNGGIWGHQPFVFSKDRLYALYPNLTGEVGITATPTLCKRGLAGKWAYTVGPGGIYFLAQDGIFLTTGGPEEWISRDIDPLFKGQSRYGLLPVNVTAESALRMTVWEDKLYFGYQDTGGDRHTLVYSILTKFWRHYTFGRAPDSYQGEDEDTLIIGSLGLGASYTHDGFSDAGLAISGTLRTGAVDGDQRHEKLLGDQIIDADRQGITLTVTNFLNEEAITNAAVALDEGTGRQRYILDVFGDLPQKAHSISTQIAWSSSSARPSIHRLGYAVTMQPEITANRVTNWDDLGSADEIWLTGVTCDCDTGGINRTIVIERDFNGQRQTVDSLTVNAAGRHKLKFSWPAVPAHQVRIRPDDDCKFWLLYKVDWIYLEEPPRVSKWDIHFENSWDAYYTGLDLYCDTGNQEKQIEIYVDEVRISNALQGLTYFPVTANGRKVIHLTLPWGRGHVFRFRAIDDNPGLLYQHRWHLQEEPSEQANWNQNFSIYGTRADKYLKAIIFECDTFGQTKNVQIEVDGTTVETLAISANGRSVIQRALTVQQLGRVWRMFPVDGNPARLYSAQPIFDEEPFQLTRWETQETNHGLPGWFQVLWGHITLKSSAPVVLSITLHHNQDPLGGSVTKTYEIASTGGLKRRVFVSVEAGKGALVKYVLTSASAFWLYREETTIMIQPWGAGDATLVQPFGSDNLDPTRPMVHSELAAAAPGGSLGR